MGDEQPQHRFPSAEECEAFNCGARFHPQTDEDGTLPCAETAGALTFTYLDHRTGTLRVSIHLDSVDPAIVRPDGTVPLRVDVGDTVLLDVPSRGHDRRHVDRRATSRPAPSRIGARADRYGGRLPGHRPEGAVSRSEVGTADAAPIGHAAGSKTLADVRGSMFDGYDDDRVNAVLGRVNEAFGIRVVCVWNYVDAYGFAGDSDFYVEDAEGRLHYLSGRLWLWLNRAPDHADAPEAAGTPAEWFGSVTGMSAKPMAGDGRLNYAIRDLRDT
ncbi:hypothetical protein [Embleya sp. NBC_00896]|uniref:hypothetical protein n=1 Tax=Embleya sp. NBC_00896 TaxID=2975961 RepID=UPI002F9153CC|nr:hypothetical protein OG928_48625 [Embleya sp. NBC_00896]